MLSLWLFLGLRILAFLTITSRYFICRTFGYFTRPGFRESAVLSAFVQEKMQGIELRDSEYRDGRWVTRLPDLLELPLIERGGENGADGVAGFLDDLIHQMDGTP